MLQRARGLAALVVLIALGGGVPVALIRFVGRPWPSPFPAPDVIWQSVRSGDISDGAVIKLLAVLVWIAWVRLACSVVVEIAARSCGVRVPHVAGLGSAQRWAATLVAAAVLLVASVPSSALARTPAGSATVAPRPIAAALIQLDAAPWDDHASAGLDRWVAGGGGGAAVDPARRAQRNVETSEHLHVVLRHESFWSIAEGSLGDGARWREIIELNSGREVAPGVIFDGTPDRLQPGWELLVPSSASPADRPVDRPVDVAMSPTLEVADAAMATHEVLVERGDTLSGIAADELGSATAWPEIWELNHGLELSPGRSFEDPNLILPGWELIVPDVFVATAAPPLPPAVLALPTPDPTPPPSSPDLPAPSPPAMTPPVTAPAPVTNPPVTTQVASGDITTTPAAEATAITTPQSNPVSVSIPDLAPAAAAADIANTANSTDTVYGADLNDVTPPIGGIGGAVLVASGLVGAIAVRRRRRLRSAAVNARLVGPTAEAADIDRVLRGLDDGERIARLDIALRAAAHELTSGSPGVGVLGVIATADGRLDLLLDGRAPGAPTPWENVGEHRWRLPARIGLDDLAESARHSQQPCPALAHLGSTPLDTGASAELFLDLEAVGLLAVRAPAPVADSVVRALAAGIAVSPMAEIVDLITSGLGDLRLGHPSCRSAASLTEALDLAAMTIGTTPSLTAGSLSTFALRSRQHAGDAWEPVVIAAASAARDLDALSDAAIVERGSAGGRGLGVVVAGEVAGADWSLEPDGDHWILRPLGLELTPVGLTPADVDLMQRLLDDADTPPEIPAHVPPVCDGPRPDAPPAASGDVALPVDWTVMVRVLGRPEVSDAVGGAADFERSKALELVIWLTQHRDRSTRSGARTGLWETAVRDATFANVVSDARRSLARLVAPPDGAEWIGRTLTDDLPLHPLVLTDADVLADRLRAGAGLAARDAIGVLRPALALVRDIPFAGSNYLWPDTEGITSELILLVTSAATVLAGHYLVLGDSAGVFWATGQGLRVLPGHEELIALRMRAHGRQGDLAGVRHVWDSYEKVLNADTWSDGQPAPKLVALRRELLTASLAPTA